jgi:phosphopantothenoylcysteine decarboxylase/phosphopantothenate--cysteine ligase
VSWSGRHVVLGVSGGIASYKSCLLARQLTEAGARVDVVLTEGAAAFVRPVVFEALTGRPVLTSLWERDQALSHIRLAKDADLILVAPATAHLMARVAMGLADDLLTTILLARTIPVLMAPAMNDEMFAHPATRANLRILKERGMLIVGPEVGPLAEGPSERPGRMSEPEAILAHAVRLVEGKGHLAGRRVVVTAGPTREALDRSDSSPIDPAEDGVPAGGSGVAPRRGSRADQRSGRPGGSARHLPRASRDDRADG